MLDMRVHGMTCQHCVAAVSEAVGTLPGVLGVTVDLASGQVRVQGEPDPTAVEAAIRAEGYTVR